MQQKKQQPSLKSITAEQVLSAKARVESGQEIPQLTWTFFMWLISSIAITVATGIYLWSKDDGKRCLAPNSYADRNFANQANWVDVGKRFDDVFKIFFACAITDVVRSFIMIIAVQRKSGGLATLYQALVLNDVLGFGAIFVLHCFRFQLSGKICAGDYDDATNYPFLGEYLLSKGRYLIGLVCFVWVGGVFLCLLSTCVALCQFKPILYSILAWVTGKWRAISIVHRMEKGNQTDLLSIQFVFQTLQALALFVATAAFLWNKETDNLCLGLDFSVTPSNPINVSKRFRDILKIWWTYALVDFFRSLIALLAVNINSKKLAYLY